MIDFLRSLQSPGHWAGSRAGKSPTQANIGLEWGTVTPGLTRALSPKDGLEGGPPEWFCTAD